MSSKNGIDYLAPDKTFAALLRTPIFGKKTIYACLTYKPLITCKKKIRLLARLFFKTTKMLPGVLGMKTDHGDILLTNKWFNMD